MKKEDSNKKYAPNRLPSQITRTIYVQYGIGRFNEGQIRLSDTDYHGSDGLEKVTLAEHTITLGIPPQGEKEIKGKVLKLLEEDLKKVRAENFAREKDIQDKIDNLKAIEFQSGEVAHAG